jgi:Na+/glutamate symporter
MQTQIFERLSESILVVCCCRAYSESDFCLSHVMEDFFQKLAVCYVYISVVFNANLSTLKLGEMTVLLRMSFVVNLSFFERSIKILLNLTCIPY